jgi:hypothetical protein
MILGTKLDCQIVVTVLFLFWSRGRRKQNSADLGGSAAAAPGSASPQPVPPQQETPHGEAASAAKRRRRGTTASASEIETLVIELTHSSGSDPGSGGEASAPPDAAAGAHLAC